MRRVHILGLPRSGTTALANAVSQGLGLPLVVEPIFVWTDGFRVSLSEARSLDRTGIARVRQKIATLDRLYADQGGYVEKTPSSIFFAPILGELTPDATIILIKRDREQILRSLGAKLFDGKDGNVPEGSSLGIHNFSIQAAKIRMLLRTHGIFAGFAALLRIRPWLEINSIRKLSNVSELERYVDTALHCLEELDLADSERLLSLSYEDFRSDPARVLNEVLAFCSRPGSGVGNAN